MLSKAFEKQMMGKDEELVFYGCVCVYAAQ